MRSSNCNEYIKRRSFKVDLAYKSQTLGKLVQRLVGMAVVFALKLVLI